MITTFLRPLNDQHDQNFAEQSVIHKHTPSGCGTLQFAVKYSDIFIK